VSLDSTLVTVFTMGSVVDFKAVMPNAKDQGIDLQEVAIQYENLTTEELSFLEKHQTVTHRLGEAGRVLARFPEKGFPLYQDKATAVHYLGA